MYVAQPIEWTDRGVVMLDQRRLPGEEISYTYTTYQDVAKAIREMVIRGAPAIGVAAAMGVAIGVQNSSAKSLDESAAEFPLILDTLAKTRPTAVDLFWALDRMKRRFRRTFGANFRPVKIKSRSRRGSQSRSFGKTRHRRSHRPLRRRIHAARRPRDDAMQCRRAGHRRYWHGARRHSSCRRARQKTSRPGAGNSSVSCRVRVSPPGNCTAAKFR